MLDDRRNMLGVLNTMRHESRMCLGGVSCWIWFAKNSVCEGRS